MQKLHMPQVDARYWLGIMLASVFGTNLGDLYAEHGGLGPVAGVTLLAMLAAGVFLVERADQRPHQLYYWLVIIIIRTGATNIADVLAYGARIPMPALCAGLAVLLALLAWRYTRADAGAADPREGERLPATGGIYWSAMLVAGVLGTALGDYSQHLFGQTGASLGLLALLGALLARRGFGVGSVGSYWATVALARTAGTAVGDLLAENEKLAIGLALATCLSGAAFLAVLLVWRSRGRDVPA